jgi:hypothetical protein
MTDAPETIWALADRRKHWQAEPPQDGQHAWHWTEYTRTDIHDISQARIAQLEAALQNIKREYDPSECGLNAKIMFEIARAALKDKP